MVSFALHWRKCGNNVKGSEGAELIGWLEGACITDKVFEENISGQAIIQVNSLSGLLHY